MKELWVAFKSDWVAGILEQPQWLTTLALGAWAILCFGGGLLIKNGDSPVLIVSGIVIILAATALLVIEPILAGDGEEENDIC